MNTIKMYDLLKRRVLVTRESAREIKSDLAMALAESQGEITLDFTGVDSLTPSFLDEMLRVIKECTNGKQFHAMIKSPPAQFSSKFALTGRGHGLALKESAGGAWIISREEIKSNA
jgi:hypothetical protein